MLKGLTYTSKKLEKVLIALSNERVRNVLNILLCGKRTLCEPFILGDTFNPQAMGDSEQQNTWPGLSIKGLTIHWC